MLELILWTVAPAIVSYLLGVFRTSSLGQHIASSAEDGRVTAAELKQGVTILKTLWKGK